MPQLLQHIDSIRCHSCSCRKSKTESLLPSDLYICLSGSTCFFGNRTSVLRCFTLTLKSSNVLEGLASLCLAPHHMTSSRSPFGSCLIYRSSLCSPATLSSVTVFIPLWSIPHSDFPTHWRLQEDGEHIFLTHH